MELKWKCQSLSYFSPPPISGVLVKHVISAGGPVGCARGACRGSHVFMSACARPCDAGPATRQPRAPYHCCAGTHGSARENSLNAGAQARRRPTDGSISQALPCLRLICEKKVCIHNKQQQHRAFIPKIKTKQ